MFDPNERIESIKAGTLAAVSVCLTYSIVTLGNNLLSQIQIATGFNLLVKVAIALVSGFLFGVTYRYIIREDRNSHLKTGAVFAFGLVRGLGQIEVGLNFPDTFWLYALLGVESILLFAIARFTLDLAIYRSWLKPFKSS
jgi:hypothetical protein